MASRKNTISSQIESYGKTLVGLQIARVVFFIYAFISFLFWCLNCFEVDWIYSFEKLFIIPYMMVHAFYQPKGVGADFSLAIIGALSLFLGFGCEFVSNIISHKIEDLEEQLERQAAIRRNKKRKMAMQKNADELGSNNNMPLENARLLFILLPHVNKIKKNESDLELTFQEVDVWQQRVYKRFIENIVYSKPEQKGYYRKNLFLVYKDFNYVDEFIYYFRPTIDTIILEFKKYGIIVSFLHVLNVIRNMQNLDRELDFMDTILSLNFENEIITTNAFKLNYDNRVTKKYSLEYKGEYNLSKNLTISNRQSLYVIVDKERAVKFNGNESY